MCLDLEWKTGFLASARTLWLSHQSTEVGNWAMFNSENKDWSQESSEHADDKALYSLSVLDLATTPCFLDDQEIRLLSR